MLSTAHILSLLLLAQSADGEHPNGGGPAEASQVGADLVITSDSDCPTSDAIREALAGLRPPAEWPDAEVAIKTTARQILIVVGAREPIQRELAVGPDCGARASSAALVIATWMDDLPAQVTRAPVLEVVAAEPTAPAPRSDPTRYEMGAGLAAARGGGWGFGARAEIIALRAGHAIGWQASLDIVAPRTLAVDGGLTHWMRTSATVGVNGRLAFDRLFVATDLGVSGAYTAAWGTEYTMNANDMSFTWGPTAGIRAGIPWTRLRPWIDLHVRWWVRGDEARIDSPSPSWIESAQLPSWDWQASVGLSYLL